MLFRFQGLLFNTALCGCFEQGCLIGFVKRWFNHLSICSLLVGRSGLTTNHDRASRHPLIEHTSSWLGCLPGIGD